MDNRLDDDDRKALAALDHSPPHRKVYSHSHQLRSNTGGHYRRHHQPIRKHSLDEDDIPTKKITDRYYESSSDDDFFPYATPAPPGAINNNPSLPDNPQQKRFDYDHCDHSIIDSGGGGGNSSDEPLPEFVAGGGEGIFKVPVRAVVHPGRPPFLELRPHPLRETQIGKFLRTIACTDSQLWAGQESGVRVWNLKDAYKPGIGVGGRARRGDEDAAPFYESGNTSPTTCLMIDTGSRLVWSGHKDGKIRSWKMDQPLDDTPFKEGLSWLAHRGPVLSMVLSSHGDLWSSSEGGVIRVWPWEIIEKSLSLSPEERHMASLLVERSFIDLKSLVTVNGVCNISSADVKCLLSDNVRAKVWAAGPLSFSLWDARTRELLKVYNLDGHTENRVDTSAVQDQAVEDDMNVKFVSKSKKEKSQNSFLQRSRNAIIGAAGAVRRVATKGTGAFADDSKKTEALVLTADGMIWCGCSNGLLVQWDGNGNRLQDFHHHHCAVQCFCTVGSRIWVGYVSGMVQVLDLEGNLIAGWVAHTGPVIKLVVGRYYIFSLATHGGIRGWNISSPGPLDNVLRSGLAAKELMYTRHEKIKILVGTWNVGQGRASHEALMSWLGSSVSDVGIVVVGLQEVEMGAGFLAMSAAKESVGLEGSSVGQWWQDAIGKALDEGSTFERVGSRQLAALVIAIWVRKPLRTHVGDLDVAAVACGLGRAIGNKGGVGLRLRVYDRIMCFVNCHLAAHLEAVNRRNADFNHIYRSMVFTRSSNLLNTAAAGVSTSAQTLRSSSAGSINTDEGRPDLAEADLVIFLGDFNYRLFGITYDEARDFVSQRSFDWLRERDQLRAEMIAGKVFQGMHEAIIRFPPTYKFEKGKAGLGGYDSGEKKRIPAWCDRILYRDSRSSSSTKSSLECPVASSILLYEACMDVTESDHKPVRCKLNVQIARVDRSVRREEFGRVMEHNDQIRSSLQELCYVPDTVVSTNSITLQNQDACILKITNRSGADTAIFEIVCEGQFIVKEDKEKPDYCPRGGFGFPRWLTVTPAAGIMKPDQVLEISIRHEESHTLEELVDGVPQSWWSEDTRDKELILLVTVRGSCSIETRTHRIHVRHSFSSAPAMAKVDSSSSSAQTITKADSRSSSSRKSVDSSSSDKAITKADSRSSSSRKGADSSSDKIITKADSKNSSSKKGVDSSSEKATTKADSKSSSSKKGVDSSSEKAITKAESKSSSSKKNIDSSSAQTITKADSKSSSSKKSSSNY